MATLWAIITGNSTLPVQAGNNFWDHLNNQAGGGAGTIIVGGGLSAEIDMSLISELGFTQNMNLLSPELDGNIAGSMSVDLQQSILDANIVGNTVIINNGSGTGCVAQYTEDPPANPEGGTLWLKPSTKVLSVYTSSGWEEMVYKAEMADGNGELTLNAGYF